MACIRRANGQFPCMSPAVSCSRLRHVQSLLWEGEASPDGILCSLGIDSRYNEGCSELANYLFYGLYRKNHLNLGHILEDFPEEVLDDVIVLIKAESVHLYCNPVNYSYLLPYVSHWRNLTVHCMNQSEYEDEEAAEEFKISSFVSMVQDCSRIGVPYSTQGHIQTFDMFMIEKWPIIQAFALEGIGGGSFFTMKYKLMDISEKLWQTYTRLDPVSLDNLLTEDLVLFEKQWSSFFSSFDIESHLSILELSEAQAGEAFRSYFSHGLISSNIADSSRRRQPLVLFGSHSSMENLHSYSFNFPSDGHQVRNTGPQGTPAKHMVLQCVAPKGSLACSRTYFFGTTHIPYLGNDNMQQRKTELLLLSQIYAAAVQSVLAGIKCYSNTTSAAKAKDVAEHTFQLALDSAHLPQYRTALRSKSVFHIQAVNNQGRIVPLSEEGSCFLVKTASMSVYDIPDLQWGKGDLGSVIFSESFLVSSINIQQKDGSVSSDSCYTILTTALPRYVCWLVESDVKHSEKAQVLLKEEDGTCLGTSLTTADTAHVFSNSQLSTPEEGKMSFFTEGILFLHPQYGTITLPRSLISSIKLYDLDSSSVVAALFVQYETALLSHLPFPLHSDDHCLVFSLQPRSQSHRAFYSQVLPVWQGSDSGLSLQLVDREQLTWDQRNMHSRLQWLHDCHAPPVAKRRGSLKASYSQLPEQDMFLQHFALSSVGQEPIQDDHLGALFSTPDTRNPLAGQTDKVVITIISGLPGSHKNRLVNFLVQLNREGGRWVVYRPGPDSSDCFSTSHLQRYLSCFLETQRAPGGKPRLLLLTPGCTDVLEVVQAVLSHPDAVVQACFTIGAVTACVDPLSSYMEHRFVFPKLVEQCSQGIVSTVIFTGLTAEQKNPLLQTVQQLIRSANPNAVFILAERGAVTRNEDVKMILSESSFSEAQMMRARYLLYPGWCKGRFSSGCGSLSLVHQYVMFNLPLERPLFLKHCKAFKSALRPNPFRGNVYNICGKVLFSDSERMMEVSFNTVSGNLRITQQPLGDSHQGDQEPSGSFLQFHGVGLTQEALKDWLRLCVKQKEVRKVKKTHTSLSAQEIRTIHVKRHLDPLPPGFFYNGQHYVSFFGEKKNFHPQMDQFITEYVEEANREIDLFNNQLEQQQHQDLFDP
ncbi:dynein axonemal assembly factor 9 isoform X2 [Salmo trutta]|uniref:Dynein axonemal assembly factor 9 n=1 Tax=Salmo trutta TaxID=8032 RepID=A0A673YET0_SALTR|nr:uncharacterized protein C20orf194 homolog isoform X1 [Salmo trutta]XP_029568456.1 uncharacterized protein C20orf194 homolog isoform X2 [Salmo trutta]